MGAISYNHSHIIIDPCTRVVIGSAEVVGAMSYNHFYIIIDPCTRVVIGSVEVVGAKVQNSKCKGVWVHKFCHIFGWILSYDIITFDMAMMWC